MLIYGIKEYLRQSTIESIDLVFIVNTNHEECKIKKIKIKY